jgi:hypothetical protein
MRWKSKTNGQRKHVPHKQTLIITIRNFELVNSLIKPLIRIYFSRKLKNKIFFSKKQKFTSNIVFIVTEHMTIDKPNKYRLKRNPSLWARKSNADNARIWAII